MLRRLAAALLLSLAAAPLAAQPAPLGVFAAASLQDALRVLEPAWLAQRPDAPLRLVFAASSTLARQIEQGAPAEIFASADERWMDWAAERNLIDPATRRSPLGNTLVLVGPAMAVPVALAPGLDWLARLGPQGRLSVGDPAHVPAGRYAEEALKSLGAWDALRPRLARAENVRAALLLVERGEAPLGIVYGTDAALAPGLRVLGTFPPGSHTPVTYPFAVTRRGAADPRAAELLGFLTGPEAAPVWRRFGFALRAE